MNIKEEMMKKAEILNAKLEGKEFTLKLWNVLRIME